MTPAASPTAIPPAGTIRGSNADAPAPTRASLQVPRPIWGQPEQGARLAKAARRRAISTPTPTDVALGQQGRGSESLPGGGSDRARATGSLGSAKAIPRTTTMVIPQTARPSTASRSVEAKEEAHNKGPAPRGDADRAPGDPTSRLTHHSPSSLLSKESSAATVARLRAAIGARARAFSESPAPWCVRTPLRPRAIRLVPSMSSFVTQIVELARAHQQRSQAPPYFSSKGRDVSWRHPASIG
jgi:hypothetical protein